MHMSMQVLPTRADWGTIQDNQSAYAPLRERSTNS